MNRLILLICLVSFGAFAQPNMNYKVYAAGAYGESLRPVSGVLTLPPLSLGGFLHVYNSTTLQAQGGLPLNLIQAQRWELTTGQQAEVYLGTDGLLDRPVIIVEGYDPYNNKSFSTYWNDYNMSSLGQSILNSGRDIVFINYAAGGADIEGQATQLELLIRYFGDVAKSKGKKMAVIGVSMGGVVARIALANVEKKGADHNLSLYVSYDAPHRGANLPVDIISQVNAIEDRTDVRVCGLISKCRSARNKLRDTQKLWKSMAARQMLVTGDLARNFYSKLKNQIGYPTKLRKVAFSNGSGYGREQTGLYQNERILEYRVNYNSLIHGSDRTYTVKTHALGSAYKGYFSYSSSFFDIAPGGTLDGFGQIATEMTNNGNVKVLYNSGLRNHTFIPTVSALDMNTTNLKTNASANSSPFDAIYHAGYSNLSHSNLSHHKNSLLSELNQYQ
ncbi:MAG: hypothetical protein MJK04_20160 [Psychrosphaera sp.]|nr:hypothetical protein [Psychrosphaera sp.]